MHIVNIMLSAIAGGIEQAFVDYCEALSGRGHRVTAITHPRAYINPQLKALGIEINSMRNWGENDFFAKHRLRKHLQALRPDVVLTHTNRSFSLARPASQGLCPLVGVAHNYNERGQKLVYANAVFAITRDLINFMEQQAIPKERIFHIPNMARCHELPHRGALNQPPLIGAMGRFVKKKGFDIYIDALKILKDRGYEFTAILGGIGEEEKALKKYAHTAGISDLLSFPGWLSDKKAFYEHIDIFCLPSLHEPFGIVLLEAFTHGAPVVASNSEGPRDIITPNFDALLCEVGNAGALADGIEKLLKDPKLADELAANAFAKAKTTYAIERVGERIEKALETVVRDFKAI